MQQYKFNSYIVSLKNLKKNTFGHRLLEVDNRLLLPTNVNLRFLITSSDVLHSWAVPALGLKTDACPGRLNNIETFINRKGIFYGQCSEICGTNHAFMPIVIRSAPLAIFEQKIYSLLSPLK